MNKQILVNAVIGTWKDWPKSGADWEKSIKVGNVRIGLKWHVRRRRRRRKRAIYKRLRKYLYRIVLKYKICV